MDIEKISIVGMDGSVKYQGTTIYSKSNKAGDVCYAGEPLTIDTLRSFLDKSKGLLLKRTGSTKYNNGVLIVESSDKVVLATVHFDEVFSVRTHKGTTKSNLQSKETIERWFIHFNNAFLKFLPDVVAKDEKYYITLDQYKMMLYHAANWIPDSVEQMKSKEAVLTTLQQIRYANVKA